MERQFEFYPRPNLDERKLNTKNLGRLARRLAIKWDKQDWDKQDIEDVTAEDMIDVETVLLLHRFQTAFIAGVASPHCYVREHERYQQSIGKIGPIFEALRLAKPLQGSVLGWRPTKTLKRIISARLAASEVQQWGHQ